MRWLATIFIFATVIVAGSMAFNDMIVSGGVLAIGSLLGFAGGSGMRGSFYMGLKKSGIVIGLILLAAGMVLTYWWGVTLTIVGVTFSAALWVALGAALGFLAARPADVMDRNAVID